jgi:hypothetical protein
MVINIRLSFVRERMGQDCRDPAWVQDAIDNG